jgi:DNA-binding response OmpR family regulator
MGTDPKTELAEGTTQSFDFRAVLLVDDDRQLASTLQWVLADQSFLVDVAYDGRDALAKLKTNKYDAIICDVMMPYLRGDQFYTEAIAIHPELANHFVFITGYAADPQVNLFLCKTGCKYLMKPFPVQKLIDCLEQLLA